MWRCEQRNTKLIIRLVHEFHWWRAFSNLNRNERLSPSNKTILIIASDFIPHKTVIRDDRKIIEEKIL